MWIIFSDDSHDRFFFTRMRICICSSSSSSCFTFFLIFIFFLHSCNTHTQKNNRKAEKKWNWNKLIPIFTVGSSFKIIIAISFTFYPELFRIEILPEFPTSIHFDSSKIIMMSYTRTHTHTSNWNGFLLLSLSWNFCFFSLIIISLIIIMDEWKRILFLFFLLFIHHQNNHFSFSWNGNEIFFFSPNSIYSIKHSKFGWSKQKLAVQKFFSDQKKR